MKGRIRWWNNERGYGFIEYETDSNIFAHLTKEDKLNYSFEEDQIIEFELAKTSKGLFLTSINVKK